MRRVEVNASRKYDILIGRGLIGEAGRWIAGAAAPCTAALITDDTVDRLYGDQVEQSLIEVEVTESAFMEDHKTLIQVMKQLKEQGFDISIDDFGTGYSSLSMLTELPADTVKLDKEFLKNSDSDTAKRMLRNVIRLITDNRMQVLCEGVESEEQAEFLADAGCDTEQGFHFSRPVPVARFEELYFV